VDPERDLLAGVGTRMRKEGLLHHGIELRVRGQGHRIDLTELTGGRSVMVYAQQEVVKDLIAARLGAGGRILFEAAASRVEDHETDRPRVRFAQDGRETTLACDFVAGCDGFHGVSRAAVPPSALRVFERVYPYAWLGILAQSPPPSDELIYAFHDDGFALYSMRSPSVSRLYIQCPPDDAVAAWPDGRIWAELEARLGPEGGRLLRRGAVRQKAITPMRSHVVEPMRHGRLFLAGDAAHIVPPTGAKGLNLAVADVRLLARALEAVYSSGDSNRLDSYSSTALRRVWQVQHFSWWMTTMLHRAPQDTPFDTRLQQAQLDQVTRPGPAAAALAENYTGLPFED
jgi:p-hydroxybenzoate 3-monooxygenase